MYFREIDESYSIKPWYLALRGLINTITGLTIFLKPEWATDLVIQLLAVWLILNNIIQLSPFFMGHRTKRLWPEAFGSSIVGFIIGLVAIFKDQLAVDAVAVLVGILLLFRALIELGILAESHMRAYHQRRLLLWVGLSLVFGVNLIINPFRDVHVLEQILGVYATLIGLNHILTASRRSQQILEREEHAHTVISDTRYVPVESINQLHLPEEKKTNQEQWTPLKPGDKLDIAKYKRPIVIAAHPDDLEAFAGGLVYQLKGVLSVIFAGGDKGVWSPEYKTMDHTQYIHIRLDEAAKAGTLLGITEIIYMGYLDRGIKATEENIKTTLSILEQYQPDLIVSFEYHHDATLDPHPDHLAVGEITRQAVATYKTKNQLDYLVMSTLFPNVFIDVSQVRRIKLEALACHTTQTGLNSVIFPFLEKLTTKLWGAYNGVDYAEGYRLINSKN